jgi:CheY-like chemotaxis protein
MRALYGFMLLAAGYKVKTVTNGFEALAEIQLDRPDVIVTDLAMPVLSGIEMIQAIKSDSRYANIPVIAITSFGENMRELARAVGANVSIDKPEKEEQLTQAINSVLAC